MQLYMDTEINKANTANALECNEKCKEHEDCQVAVYVNNEFEANPSVRKKCFFKWGGDFIIVREKVTGLETSVPDCSNLQEPAPGMNI